MALRNPKISSEIIRSCKYFSCKAAAPIAQIPIVTESEPAHFRYKIATTEKPKTLPKLPEAAVRVKYEELQPTSLPKFHEFEQAKPNPWTIPDSVENPFPDSVKVLCTPTVILSDKDKAIQRFAETRTTKMTTRNYSTAAGPFTALNRMFSSSTDDSCKKKKKKKCFPEGRKPNCKVSASKKCPRFKLCNCEELQAKMSDCKHYYKDPHCKKQEAPYPAYSETCVRDLDDDPSECVQCPWYPCGRTVDDLKIPKRDYHTSTRAVERSSASAQFVPFMDVSQSCDARKKPCPPPPDKCKERNKKMQEQKDKPKRSGSKGNKQKAESGWTNAFGMWASKQSNILDMNQVAGRALIPAGYQMSPITKKEDCPQHHNIKKPKVDHTTDCLQCKCGTEEVCEKNKTKKQRKEDKKKHEKEERDKHKHDKKKKKRERGEKEPLKHRDLYRPYHKRPDNPFNKTGYEPFDDI